MGRRQGVGRAVRLAVAAAVVAALVAGACGGDDAPVPSAAEPCRLFTRAELRLQFNVPPKRDTPAERYPAPVRPENSPVGLVGTETCGTDGVYVGVGLTLAPESYAKWRDQLGAGADTVTTVKGLGTKAVWVRGESSQRLVVLDGDMLVAIVDTTLAGHGLERARSLARKALAKL